jgi:hypothetical protein
MNASLLVIECGRCGETRLEVLTEVETQAIRDAVGPAYRHCAQCGRTTGWVAGRGRLKAELINPSTRKSSRHSIARPVYAGRERLASQAERDAISEFLRQRAALRLTEPK